jgi:hypothetical protein
MAMADSGESVISVIRISYRGGEVVEWIILTGVDINRLKGLRRSISIYGKRKTTWQGLVQTKEAVVLLVRLQGGGAKRRRPNWV